jgi:hypothetical protein
VRPGAAGRRLRPHYRARRQAVAGISRTFKVNLIAWLGSAANGIKDFTRKKSARRNPTGQKCARGATNSPQSSQEPAAGTPTLGSGAPSGQPASPQADASTTTSITTIQTQAPQLEVNAANPATISVGSTYADLGASPVSTSKRQPPPPRAFSERHRRHNQCPIHRPIANLWPRLQEPCS